MTLKSAGGVIERYRRFLPVSATTPVITLHEGSTPLIPAVRLGPAIHPNLELHLKYEGVNPTGSFKDRGMTVAVSKAVEAGLAPLICASTGNTSASAAAYAAAAGIPCLVLIPAGKIALGKLAQTLAVGARVIEVEGNFDACLCLVREIAAQRPVGLVNSVNPYRLEGQKTAAFEVVDALGQPPDYHALPVGNAGNITAYWRGYQEYKQAGLCSSLPAMLGFQASGAAPIVLGYPVEQPDTVASAIRIGNPASWAGAVAARDESGGIIESVTDIEIMHAYQQLATLEGVFGEPASCAAIAGLYKLAAQGWFAMPSRVVATITGHGLKDPDSAMANVGGHVESIPATVEALLGALDR